MENYTWEFTLERLQEIRDNPREAMIGRQEAERLVDSYLADYRRGITCSHCACDMSKNRNGRCSNGGLCVSIEEFDQRKSRDYSNNQDALIKAAEELLRIAYANGCGGIVEFRPHELDDLQDAIQAAKP